MMESVASSLLRTRSAGEGVCDWAGVSFGRRRRANTKMVTMDFLIVVARFMVESPRRRSDVRGYCKGILGLWGCVDGEKLKAGRCRAPGRFRPAPRHGKTLVRSQECLRAPMVCRIRTKACRKNPKPFLSGGSHVFRKSA